MTNFVECIWDYGSTINYNIIYSKVVYKYLLKVFYRRINKKEYKLQIFEHNIRHINIIAMQNAILIVKVPVGSVKKIELDVDLLDAEVTQV